MTWSQSARSDAAMQGSIILLSKIAHLLSEDEQKRLLGEFYAECRDLLVKYETVVEHLQRRVNPGESP